MTTVSNGARPYPKVSTLVLPGMAQTVRALDCPLGDVTRLSAGSGALLVIMSIIGPRETYDYRNYNLLVRYNHIKKINNKKRVLCRTLLLAPRPPAEAAVYLRLARAPHSTAALPLTVHTRPIFDDYCSPKLTKMVLYLLAAPPLTNLLSAVGGIHQSPESSMRNFL